VAIEALAWLAQDSARLERFLAISGLGPGNLRQAAAEPSFLGAVLDYLAGDESLLIAFSEATRRAPRSVSEARDRLRLGDPGGDS
jgi:Protein of unknown function (DUF3572)